MVDCCCRCRPYPCTEFSHIELTYPNKPRQKRCGDSESVESVESVEIVGSGDGAPGGGKRGRKTTRQPRTTRTRTTTRQLGNMEDESTIRTTPAMLYARGGAGGNASKGSCPGSLEACIEACPSDVKVFKVCSATCGRRCSKK